MTIDHAEAARVAREILAGEPRWAAWPEQIVTVAGAYIDLLELLAVLDGVAKLANADKEE